MRYKLGCRLGYRQLSQTPFVFNIEVQSFGNQSVVQECLTTIPRLEVEPWLMPETGNRYLRLNAPAGMLDVEYTAVVNWTPELEEPGAVSEVTLSRLPLSVFPHLYPSRYCQSDKLERFARSTFGGLERGYARVNGICNWIHDYVAYEGGVSDALTSAFDTVTQRAGVCRDFAHLGIALCRTLGIPARYASVYASQLAPPDFHAVFEAYLDGPNGGGWYLFDPTRLADPAGLIRIGVGRDAADVAFCSPFAFVTFDKPQVWIEPLEPLGLRTTMAIRAQAG